LIQVQKLSKEESARDETAKRESKCTLSTIEVYLGKFYHFCTSMQSVKNKYADANAIKREEEA